MPKQKSHSGATKRFRKTGKKRIMRENTKLRHNLENKPRTTKLGKHGTTEVSAADRKRVAELLSA